MDAGEIFGLVLSGGRSSRMGTDKSTLNFHGQPQLDHMIGLLTQVCKSVFVSARKEQALRSDVNYLLDQFDIQGPMNGIRTALESNPQVAWLIVAVDMPNVGHPALRELIVNRDPSKLATCFFNEHKKWPEPLLALWEPAARMPIQRFVRDGKNSPRDFLSSHHVNMIQPVDPSILLNVNSPEDLLNFRKNINKG
ncbi:MAG TPA: NTP transferase domain-containing protein [Sphingobacteriaceae bacterium]